MKIAMLAPPWIEIPPPGYGGIEQVVALAVIAFPEGSAPELVLEGETGFVVEDERARSPIR